MPYEKTNWVDEVPASTPVEYTIDGDGGTITNATIEVETPITPGTPVNASNLNHMEDGIETAQETAENAGAAAASAQATANAAIPKSIATAVGDILYATASAVWAKLAKPSVNSVLRMTPAGSPSWKAESDFIQSLIYRRQGGDADDWNVGGTTSFTPAAPLIQVGKTSNFQPVTSDGSYYYYHLTVTFPQAFNKVPLILLTPTPYFVELHYHATHVVLYSISVSSFHFYLFTDFAGSAINWYMHWMAIGE
ncbi:MAG: hypothetical protein HY865_22220 [Chloroflexi bacterium]|nr:hypothetical protein [Chloroflexota bacterium]